MINDTPTTSAPHKRRRLLWTGASAALAAGIALYLMGFTRTGEDPEVCGSCHEIKLRCERFLRSQHRAEKAKDVTCLDCHATEGPKGRIAAKLNGTAFLLAHMKGQEPTGTLSPEACQIVEVACVRCHGGYEQSPKHTDPNPKSKLCLACHANTGHQP